MVLLPTRRIGPRLLVILVEAATSKGELHRHLGQDDKKGTNVQVNFFIGTYVPFWSVSRVGPFIDWGMSRAGPLVWSRTKVSNWLGPFFRQIVEEWLLRDDSSHPPAPPPVQCNHDGMEASPPL